MLTGREREARRRKYRRRRILIAVSVIVALVLLTVALSMGLSALRQGSDESTDKPTDGTPTSTTTTAATTAYPTMAESQLPDIGIRTNDLQVALLYDVTTGQPIFSFDADRRMYPASITKLMTAAVACEYLDEAAPYTIGSEIYLSEEDASGTGLLWNGKEVTLQTLIEGLLMFSDAEAAYCLAATTARVATGNPHLSDTDAIAKFMEMVNDKLAEIGCADSHFVTPDGYHDNAHCSTANDLLKIALHARSYPLIAKTVKLLTSEAYPGEYYQSTNALLDPESEYYYPYADGLKTGSTDEACYCLAASATKGDHTLIAIVLCHHDSGERFAVARTLLEEGFRYLETQGR